MINFFLRRDRFPNVLTRRDMSHDDCMRLACHMPVDVLTQDIEEWRDKAKHGDIYVLRQGEMSIIAIDHEHQPPQRALNTTLAASGILEDSVGNILMGLRLNTDAAFPGMWCTPGGGSEQGENVNQVIIREFKEEVGLTVDYLNGFLYYAEYFRSNGNRAVLIFKQVINLSPLAEAKPLDGFSKIGWFTEASCEHMIAAGQLTPSTCDALTHYFAWRKARQA